MTVISIPTSESRDHNISSGENREAAPTPLPSQRERTILPVSARVDYQKESKGGEWRYRHDGGRLERNEKLLLSNEVIGYIGRAVVWGDGYS